MKTTQTTKPANKPANANKAANKPANAAPKAEGKAQETKAASKPETPATKAETKAKILATLHVPANRPTSGGLLFAWTLAALRIVGSLPEAKQTAAARALHGSTAMKYHGSEGRKNIVPGKTGFVAYNSAFFESRKPDPKAVEGFTAYIRTGKASEVAGWKPAGAPAIVLNVTA